MDQMPRPRVHAGPAGAAWTLEDMRAFISRIREAARRVDLKGIPMDLLIARYALETGWGTGRVFKETNNPGSRLKGRSWTGPVVIGGASGKDEHRKFATLEEGIADDIQLIKDVYPKAYEAALRRDFKGHFAALDAGGYERVGGSRGKYAGGLLARYDAVGRIEAVA